MPKLFIDLDGVLANFDSHHEAIFGFRPDKGSNDVDWAAIRAVGDFYLAMPPMADIDTLWAYVSRYDPVILTGVPYSVPEASDNKRAWVRKHLGSHVEVRCCRSREKCCHASAGDILVDDWEKYRHLWLAAGGIWITHIDAVGTVRSLTAMGL